MSTLSDAKAKARANIKLWTDRRKKDKAEVARDERGLARWRKRLKRLTKPKAKRAKGIDVSNLQGNVDFAKVKAAGYSFVWLKATEGASFKDRFFQGHVREAKAVGLKVGAYHFLRESSSVDAQVDAFLDQVRAAGLGHGDLLPVVDVEAKGVTPSMAGQFASKVANRTGIRPLIYTYPAFTSWSSTFGCKLWIAHYGVRKPTIPHPWRSYAAWQHSSSGNVPGVSGRCDVNVTKNLRALIA